MHTACIVVINVQEDLGLYLHMNDHSFSVHPDTHAHVNVDGPDGVHIHIFMFKCIPNDYGMHLVISQRPVIATM